MKGLQLLRVSLSLAVFTVACGDGDVAPVQSQVDAGGEPVIHDPGLRPEQVTGTYLFGISTILARSAPIVFMVELAAETRDDQLELRLRERAISKEDRVTPVGDWSDWTTGYVDAEGRWDSGPIPVLIPAGANAIVATDTQAEIVLSGQLSELRNPDDLDVELSFLCGDVAGKIIDPIPVDDLSGSTFAGARLDDVDDPASYPEISINCARDLPRPLP